MHKYNKVRNIVKGRWGLSTPNVQITPMDMSTFMSTYKNINPSLAIQEYYRYKQAISNGQSYEPPGGNFTATQPGLEQLQGQQNSNNTQQSSNGFELPKIDYDNLTSQVLYGNQDQFNPLELPEKFKTGVTWDDPENSTKTFTDKQGNVSGTAGTNPVGSTGGTSFKDKLSNFGSNNANVISGVGQAADMARNALFAGQAASDSNTTSTINNAYDAISTSIMGFAPVGTIIGGAMKVGALVGDGLQALGGGTDQMTTTDQIMDSSFFSWNIGAINGFAGKKTQDFAVDKDTLNQVGSSYGGTTKDVTNAASKANKKYGLFSSGSRKKADRQINAARAKQTTMQGIASEASDRNAMINDLNYTNYNFNLAGGYDQRYMRAAKSGMKIADKINLVKQRRFNTTINLDTKEIEWEPIITEVEEFKEGGNLPELWEPIIEDTWEPIITDYIEEYKEGGNIKEELETPKIEETNQKNLIPEGALHKNKHHMEHTEGLTQKGIPVVDNDGEQQAEIELNEIIFTLEVTKKLEELYRSGSDEDAIEAGKLLVKEILFNTDDRTGLIAKCEEGGKLDVVS